MKIEAQGWPSLIAHINLCSSISSGSERVSHFCLIKFRRFVTFWSLSLQRAHNKRHRSKFKQTAARNVIGLKMIFAPKLTTKPPSKPMRNSND